MNILAIDPGTHKSGVVFMDNRGLVHDCGVIDNQEVLDSIHSASHNGTLLAIEMIQSFGMPVGAEVFETCVFIGRLVERWRGKHKLVYRKEVKLHLCGTPRAKDANIRQALIDVYGGKDAAIGKKANPGPLYRVKSHAWSALAVADYCRRGAGDSTNERNQ